MKALKGKIIIEDVMNDKITAGGIIKVTESKNMLGTVISTGIKDVKEGDILLFGRYAGTSIEYDGANYRCLGGDDILGIAPDGTIDSLSPVSDFMIVEPVESPKEKGGIILLPEQKQADDYSWAKVIKVGPGRFTVKGVQIKPTTKAGEEVMYAPYQSFQLNTPDRTLVMVRESHIEAVRS